MVFEDLGTFNIPVSITSTDSIVVLFRRSEVSLEH